KARFWPLVAILVLSLVFNFVVSLILGQIANVLPTSISGLLVSVAIFSLGTILISPFLPIGATLLYLDARVRMEGFGEAIQRLEKPDPRPSDVLPPAPARGGFSNSDWMNLALTIAGVEVLLLIYAGLNLAQTPPTLR